MRKEQVISTTNNNQMEEKGMKSRFIHLKKRFVPALSGALMGVMLMSTRVAFQDVIKRLSLIPSVHICFKSFPWSTLSKNPFMSTSTQ